MASEVRSAVAKLDRDDPLLAELRRDGSARLRFSQSTIEALDKVSTRLETPVTELLTQSLGLLLVAVEAQSRGERLCLLDEDLDIVGDSSGFGATVGVRVVSVL